MTKKEKNEIRTKIDYKIGDLNVDEKIREIRKILPCNRTIIRELAVKDLFETRTLRDIAEVLYARREEIRETKIKEQIEALK